MNRIGLALGALLGLFTMSCGGASSSGSYSCDTVSGGSHTCADATVSGDDISSFVTAGQTACTQGGGSLVASCSHTGAVGGCTITLSSSASPAGDVTASTTITAWAYADTAASLMMKCASIMGTFVAP